MLILRTVSLALASVLLLAASLSAGSGPAYQVADIAPNESVENQGGIVLPGYFQPTATGEVFLAPAGSSYPSLWRTDGTIGGTRPVAAGSVIGSGRIVGSNGVYAYFTGSLGGPSTIWSTDGTSEGTFVLRSRVQPGPNFDEDVAVVDGRLFFHDCDWDTAVCDLWTSDGTPEGTQRLLEIGRQAKGISGSNGVYYFFAPEVGDSRFQLWRSDGTSERTTSLRLFEGDPTSLNLSSIEGEALVSAERKLWLTEGDAVNTIADLGQDTFIEFYNARTEGGILYFLAFTGGETPTRTVWRSDGSAPGTAPVLSVPAVQGAPSFAAPWVQQSGDRVYYLIPSSAQPYSHSLWSSDLPGDDAQEVSCAGCASIPYGGRIVASEEKLYFPSAENNVHTFWVIDSTVVPRPIRDYCTGSCQLISAVAVDGGAMFSLRTQSGIDELWSTDGSNAGTQVVDTFDTLYDLFYSATLGAVLFPAARVFPQETSLWTSQREPGSARELAPVEGRGSSPRNLQPADDRVVFEACDGIGGGRFGADAQAAELLSQGDVNCSYGATSRPMVSNGSRAFFARESDEVWASGGTTSSTEKVWDGNSGKVGYLLDLFGNDLGVAFLSYQFSGQQRLDSFWRSDGTVTGTFKAFDLPAETYAEFGVAALGNEYYFMARSPVRQVWRTDGTSEGTRRLTNAEEDDFLYPAEFARAGAFVYFTSHRGIWRTNGTAIGTHLALAGAEIDDPDSPPSLGWLHSVGDVLLFQRTENGVSTLWRSLGTPETTEPLAALDPTDFDPGSAATLNGHLYFAADDGVHGVELWRTDGTAAGTSLVREFAPGASSGNPHELTVANGKLFFNASQLGTGAELWVSDGTAGGTRLVQDIAQDAASSDPGDLTLVGDLLYFSADDAVTGRELWALPLSEVSDTCVPGDEELCLRDGRFEITVEWRDFAGRTGRGHAEPLSGDTGFFWFFDDGIYELIVKIIDGRDFNGHFWVYYGSLSNVEFTVTITDKVTGESRPYPNPSGTFASLGDILAFPIDDATPATVAASAGPLLEVAAGTTVAGTCVPDAERLCLLDGRFAVEAVWTDFAGHSGAGQAVAQSADTGYFWFFSPSNVEVVAKVIDGRPVNGKFWVFYGALSNVEYRLKVTDTVTGIEHEYPNPSGRFASVGDIEAF